MSGRRSSRERKSPAVLYDTSLGSLTSPPPQLAKKPTSKSSSKKTPTSIMKKPSDASSSSKREKTPGSSAKKKTSFASPASDKDDKGDEELSEASENEESDDEILKNKPTKKARKLKQTKTSTTGGISIFQAMKKNAALNSIAKSWVGAFKGNGGRSLVDFVNLVFCCAGSSLNILEADESVGEFDEEEWGEALERAHGELDGSLKSLTKYPVHGTSKDANTLRRNMLEFCKGVVEHCRSGQSYNYVALRSIVVILNTISSSNLLPTRHAAVVMAWCLTDALVAASVDLTKKVEVCERQYAAEKKRGEKSKKCRDLADQLATVQDSLKSIEELIDTVFKGIFIHRYRDTRSELREDSMLALGRWVCEYPDKFLNDEYLKYFGWTLNDKDASVRIAVLKGIHTLLAGVVKKNDSEKLEQLTPFLNRFMSRIVQCCHDIDDKVAAEALKFMNFILLSGVLGSDDIEVDDEEIGQIDAIMFDEKKSLEIRQLAGSFMMERGVHFGEEKSKTQSAKKKSDKSSDNLARLQLEELLEFVEVMVGHEQHPCVVKSMVDALSPLFPLLTDWDTLTSCLLSNGIKSLSDKNVSLLIHIFCSAVSSNCGEVKATSSTNQGNDSMSSPKGKRSSSPSKKSKTASSSSDKSDMSESLSLALLKNLSALLSKFQTEEASLEPLVELTMRIQPQHISMGANKQRFSSLCQQLKDLLLISEGDNLTRLICDALRYLLSGDHSRQQDAQVVVQEAVTEMESAVLETLSPKKKGKSKATNKSAVNDIDDYVLNLQLNRLASLSTSVNITLFSESIDSDLIPKLQALVVARTSNLSEFIEEHNDEDMLLEDMSRSNNIVSKAMKLIYSTVLWATYDAMSELRSEDLDMVTHPEARDNVDEDLKEAEEAEEDENAEPELDADVKETIQLVLDRRAMLVEGLTSVMSYHLTSSSFDPGDGLPDAIEDLEQNVLSKVREVQMDSYGIISDLQCLHAMRLSSYDALRQLAWEPSPQITMLCANFFHAMTPSALETHKEVEQTDDLNMSDTDETSTSPVDPTEKKLNLILPLEAHIKTMLYNPNHRSRRQASAVFDFLSDASSRKLSNSAAASAKFFFDAVKMKNGVAKLLEIQMTSLQLSFTNEILSDTATEDIGFDDRIKEAYEKFSNHSKAMAMLLGIPGKISRDENSPQNKLITSMFSFLREGVRFSCAVPHEPERLGFLAGMQPFLPYLSAPTFKKKMQEHFENMFSSMPSTIKSKVSFKIPKANEEEEEEDEYDEEFEESEALTQSLFAVGEFYDKLFPGHRNQNKASEYARSKKSPTSKPKKAGKQAKRTVKRRKVSYDEEGEESEEEEEDDDEEEEEEGEEEEEEFEEVASVPVKSKKRSAQNKSDDVETSDWLEDSSKKASMFSTSSSTSKSRKKYGSSSITSPSASFNSISSISKKTSSTKKAKSGRGTKRAQKSNLNESSEEESEEEETFEADLSPKKKRKSAAQLPSQDW